MSASVLTSDSPPLLARSRAGAVALAAISPIGPLLMAGWAFALPYGPWDDIPTSIAKLQDEPMAAQLSMAFIVLAGVFGIAGSLVVGAGVRRGSPRFGALATVIAFTGFAIAPYPGPIAAIAASGGAGLSQEQVEGLVSGIDSQLQATIVNALFVTLPAGILLLGIAAMIAAFRGRRYPRWVAIVLTAAIPLVLLCGMVSFFALGIAWVFVGFAYGVGGWVYARDTTRR